MVYHWDLRGQVHVIFVSPKERVLAMHCYLQFPFLDLQNGHCKIGYIKMRGFLCVRAQL